MNTHTAFLSLSFLALTASTASAQDAGKVRKCVQLGSEIVEVDANYNAETEEYTVIHRDGREVPFEEAYPTDSTYAANAKWYTENDAIKVQRAQYQKYGLPRVLSSIDVGYLATYRNVPVFAEDPILERQEVIYIPVRPGCEFQPYKLETK